MILLCMNFLICCLLLSIKQLRDPQVHSTRSRYNRTGEILFRGSLIECQINKLKSMSTDYPTLSKTVSLSTKASCTSPTSCNHQLPGDFSSRMWSPKCTGLEMKAIWRHRWLQQKSLRFTATAPPKYILAVRMMPRGVPNESYRSETASVLYHVPI
jgi:hypothetical protein